MRAQRSAQLDLAVRALRTVPKVELHAHLSGCLRLSTLADLAAKGGVWFPRRVARDLAGAVVLRAPASSYGRSFQPWRRAIDRVTAVPEHHHRLAYEVAEDMAADGVVHAELRTSVRLPFDRAAFTTMLRGLDEAAAAAQRDHGIDVRFILGFNRQYVIRTGPAEQAEIMGRVLAVTDRFRRRVVGFDIWGNERRRPPRAFAGIFALARNAGYLLTIHAGETGAVEHVRQAVDELQCRRLGHAAGIVRDRELVEQARSKEIAVEVCLTSNRLTGVVPERANHPAFEMVRLGLPVCLCADNTLVYDTSLSREYALAVQAGLMTPEQLLDNARRMAAVTFLPADERARLEQRLEAPIAGRAEVLRHLSGLVPGRMTVDRIRASG